MCKENGEIKKRGKNSNKMAKKISKTIYIKRFIATAILVNIVFCTFYTNISLSVTSTNSTETNSNSSSEVNTNSSSEANSNSSSETNSNSSSDEEVEYRKYGSTAYINSVYIAEDGTLMPEMSIDDMWENDKRYKTYLPNKDALAYFLNAQLVTQYPYIKSAEDGELNGTIRFYRNGSTEPMEYISPEKFKAMYNGDMSDLDKDSSQYFTITKSGSIQVVYTNTDTYTVEGADSSVADEAEKRLGENENIEGDNINKGGKTVTYSSSKTNIATISYKNIVKKYVLPFNLLWSIIVMGTSKSGADTESVNFAHALATMAYEGQIDLLIDDNKRYTEDTSIYTYDETESYVGDVFVDIIGKVYDNNKKLIRTNVPVTIRNAYNISSNTVNTGLQTKYTETHTTYSPSVKIKKIMSWVAIHTNSVVTDGVETSTSGTPETNTLPDSDVIESKNKTIKNWYNANQKLKSAGASPTPNQWLSTKKNEYQQRKKEYDSKNSGSSTIEYDFNNKRANIQVKTKYTNINVTNTLTTISTSYINNGSPTSPSFNRNIVRLFNVSTFHDVKRTLSVTSYKYFISAIEKNDDTANMVDLINYIFNQVYDTDKYYKGDEDFATIWKKAYNNYNSVAGGTSGIEGIPGKVYDYLLQQGIPPVGAAAILGNMEHESGFDPACVNYIGCSGLCQWYQGRLNNLKNLAASRGTEWTDADTQIEYLWNELNSGYYKHVLDIIMNATDIDDLEYATWYFGRYFEVYFIGSYETTRNGEVQLLRFHYAEKWYSQYASS